MFSPLVLAAEKGFDYGDMLFYMVAFVLLMWLVKIFAWKPVTKMMNDRATKIADDIDSAEKSRADAETLAAQRQDALSNSHQEAATIVADAKDAGSKQREQIITNAQTDAQKLREAASADIEQQRQDALVSARKDVADLSIEIASKIIHKQLNADDQTALIDSYIEGLGKDDQTR
ncbi:F0F1 ATP synthase subunit B [Furfurilactobacillus siliginis]|uniref:ATP synthase subunit b n=1 Tax=Furfurilactobacillus siliginis TaxID=348151 RepID=A0A0R2LAL8_9LACO|nr:F0F1 ATP synthase subunit B [Furfurilactobacillus siliginis]KRN96710.1 F0F1 ATP synthase subunit B [Furfurilactobacillus siliginis]GEK28859.1 ATP synthase subunit b [Furfurilactobacillus siliginis]